MARGSDSAAARLSIQVTAPEGGRFAELERIKRVALDCARTILGTTGGRLLHIIPHHSKEARRLKVSLTLLWVVWRENHASREQRGRLVPPSRAIVRAWDAGLCPQPTEFRTRTAVWHPQNWTENWLSMLWPFGNLDHAAMLRLGYL
jgi:hypothetical protein